MFRAEEAAEARAGFSDLAGGLPGKDERVMEVLESGREVPPPIGEPPTWSCVQTKRSPNGRR